MALTIIYDERATVADQSQPDGDDLWVAAADLPAATGWELKPEGICRDELCIPVTGEQTGLLRGEGNAQQVNLAGFARYLDQPVAHDDTHGAWYFGTPVEQLRAPLLQLEAPTSGCPISAAAGTASRSSAARKSSSSPGRPGEGAALTCRSGRTCARS